jgi:multidrug efflux pump subunit AcrB
VKAVFMGIQTTPDANPLTVIANVRESIPEIAKQLPAGLEVKIAYDATEFINESIWEVAKTLAEASAIVILVIFLFLGNVRSTLIPVVTMPLSLIGVASSCCGAGLLDQPADPAGAGAGHRPCGGRRHRRR